MKKKKNKSTIIILILIQSSSNIEDTIQSSCQLQDGKKVAAPCIRPLDGKRVAMAPLVEINHLAQHLMHRTIATSSTVRNARHTHQPLEKPTPNAFPEQPRKEAFLAGLSNNSNVVALS